MCRGWLQLVFPAKGDELSESEKMPRCVGDGYKACHDFFSFHGEKSEKMPRCVGDGYRDHLLEPEA